MKKLLIFLFLLIAASISVYFYFQYQNERKDKRYLTLYGNVDVRQVNMGFRVLGRVIHMPWQEGDIVLADSLMATLERQPYEDQVKEAIANLEANKAQRIYAEQLLKRRKELTADGSISQEDLENAQFNYHLYTANQKQLEAALGVAKKNLEDTHMFAPNDGVILTRIREPGSVVREADPVYTLSLLSPIWVRTYVSEPELGLIYPGMPAEVFTDTEGSPVYKGHIGFISPVAEFTPKTVETTKLRTDLVYRLRVIVDNPDRTLLQGMPVTVRLNLQPRNEKELKPDLPSMNETESNSFTLEVHKNEAAILEKYDPLLFRVHERSARDRINLMTTLIGSKLGLK